MGSTARAFLWTAIVAGPLCGLAAGQAEPAPAAPASPAASAFDQSDPEIAQLRKLDWKSADFNALSAPQKCAALEALNHGLANIGGKADSRAELMIDYIDKNNLGEAYAAAKAKIPDPPAITFEDMEKLATAYIQTPAGAATFGGDFDGVSDSMVERYVNLYGNSARREFADAAEGRYHVRSMGMFLQQIGKADDFRTWATAEIARRQAEYQQKQAANANQAAAAKVQAQQKAAAQMALVMAQMQPPAKQYDVAAGEPGSPGQPPIPGSNAPPAQPGQPGYAAPASYPDSDAWWPSATVYASGYYASSAYRAQMNDKASDAYQRWAGGGHGTAGIPHGGAMRR